MLKKLSVIFFAVSTLCSAVARADTATSDQRPGSNDAWILIGVQPEKARVAIVPTTVKDGYVRRLGVQLFLYKPTDGFVLIKVNPGDIYSIDQSALKIGNSFFQVLYQAVCEVPTFYANSGKVEYITTVKFESEGVNTSGSIMTFEERSQYSNDQEGAKAFLISHYPNLVDKMEQGTYQMTPFNQKCNHK